MITLEYAFFALATLLTLVGGIATVAARNPIRGAMGLLTSIVGVAAMYLLLSAELLAAVQILVYAGAVVILFVFVIMLLGPSATSPKDARSAIPRYFAAVLLGGGAVAVLGILYRVAKDHMTTLAPAPPGFGHIEGFGHELFTLKLVPFELSGALLLIAVVGAVAVARGKQADPTLLTTDEAKKAKSNEPKSKPESQPSNPAVAATSGDEPAAVPTHGEAA